MIVLVLRLTLTPASLRHSIAGCRLAEKDGRCRTDCEDDVPSNELPAVWDGQEMSDEVRN